MEEVKRDRARRKLLRVTFPNVKSSFFVYMFRLASLLQELKLKA